MKTKGFLFELSVARRQKTLCEMNGGKRSTIKIYSESTDIGDRQEMWQRDRRLQTVSDGVSCLI